MLLTSLSAPSNIVKKGNVNAAKFNLLTKISLRTFVTSEFDLLNAPVVARKVLDICEKVQNLYCIRKSNYDKDMDE